VQGGGVSFDPNEFPIKAADLPAMVEKAAATPKRKAFVTKWVKVPGAWREALRGASGSAYELALTILAREYRLTRSTFLGESCCRRR
jgi:hypothetical protein